MFGLDIEDKTAEKGNGPYDEEFGFPEMRIAKAAAKRVGSNT